MKHLLLLLFICGQTLHAQTASDSLPPDRSVLDTTRPERLNYLREYNPAYYLVREINTGLPEPDFPLDRTTPQRTLEHFLLSCRDTNFARAAYALNLALLPERVQPERAAVLAEKLFYILEKRVPVDWNSLPDRPDGQINFSSAASDPTIGKPRRQVQFGSLDVQGRDVSFALQRVKPEAGPPHWLVSAGTVENIEAAYQVYGPTWLDRHVPAWADFEIFDIAVWRVVALLLLLVVCYYLFRLVRWLLHRLGRSGDRAWLDDLSSKGATPLALMTSILTFYLVVNNVLSIAGGWAPVFYAIMLVVMIGAFTWVAMRVIDYVMDRIEDRSVGDVSDEANESSRRLLTHISVGRKVLVFLIFIAGVGLVLSQFDSLRQIGFSFVASAGVASIILGLAAQSTLGNIIAGMQIAITKPARIGDTVIYEGEYGTVEEINFTYLVVKTWDQRRLVVPLRHFIDHPFENWSMNDPHLLKPIVVYADPTTDVGQIREKFAELLRADEDYDGEKEPTVQVVGVTEEAIKIRALASAKDASTAWDLHCRLREQLVAYVAQLNDGEYLPKERVMTQNGAAAVPD